MIHSSSTVILFPSFQFFVGVYSLFIASVDSGHGGQVKDETGKECDGMDEGTQRNGIFVQLSNFPMNRFFFLAITFSNLSTRFSNN